MTSQEFIFSIGIPAYKSEYLDECISSILAQTDPNFELIIVNDCSPWPVKDVVARFTDPRIKYFENEKNTGAEKVAINFNNCLDKATGDFFVLMGDDDRMAPDYLEEFRNLIGKYPGLDVYHCRSTIIDKESRPVTYTASWPEWESVYDNIWHRVKENRQMFIPDFVYRTSPLKQLGGYYALPLAWGTDEITAYRAMNPKGVAHTNKPVLHYRKHPENISATGNHELKLKAIMGMKTWFDEFLEKPPTGDQDILIHQNLKKNIGKLIQKQKVYTMASSFHTRFLGNGLRWVTKRKEYKLTISEILYSVVIFFKERKAKASY